MATEGLFTEQTTEIVKQGSMLPAQTEPPADNLLAVIARAVADPRCDVEKMERLLAMHERITAEQRKTAFMAAMSRLQAKLPQIGKNKMIIVKTVERSRYAAIEDIDQVIRPLLAEEGFAFSFDSESKDARLFVLSCKLSHKEGHSETKSLMLPIDASDFRSTVQSIGSTVSYGRRQLLKMHLNLIEKDEDNDGAGSCISEDQARNIEALLSETKSNRQTFLTKFMLVDKIEDILASDYEKAINALETKRRGASNARA